MHVIAGKATMMKEALDPSFRTYCERVVENCKVLGASLAELGYRLVSGGTDNHLIVVDLRPKGVTGKEAETALDHAGINANRNTIPFDETSPFVTSGIRLGSAACTTRGMGPEDMKWVAKKIDESIIARADTDKLAKIKGEVKAYCAKFPVYNKVFR
jgi:glycine hydroxymethyltransferase